ncbi:RHS repeat-associated core domain-containing protein [Paraburkholderia rhizosphaerae]|uniref:RHS repeat-associated protein n=1 Tax=Paraburkholderia rhizosphaerae TaxID=480658 RepID=A0A4R8LPN6_9BURK|nr:RHS repeat-associated protein [Paraburkholderia rhizosphaerae]
MYSPTLGRFLQTDPVGYKDDLNWYAYVGNNPVNFVDPDGKVAVNLIMGATNAVIGFGVSVVTGERDVEKLTKNAFVDFGVGALAGPVGGRAAQMAEQLAVNTGQVVVSTIAKLQTGSLFALGAGGEAVKAGLNGDALNAQTVTGIALGGVLSAAPGIGTALSSASKVSGASSKAVSTIDTVYSGAAYGLANTLFTTTVGKSQHSSSSGFR